MEAVSKYKISLKEQIDNYNERVREVLDGYYRRNTEGNEDPLEICVIRDANRLIDRLIKVNQDTIDQLNDAYAMIDRFVGD